MSMTTLQAKKLGTMIAKARAAKGVSIRDLAEQLDVATGWLGKLEQGEFLDPSPGRLTRIAEALDIAPSRIDRMTHGAVTQGLPEIQTYFRAKYHLTPEQIKQVEDYIDDLRRAA